MPLLVSLLAAGFAACALQDPSIELLDHAALEQRLTRVAAAHPHVEFEEIGRSRAGRAIHAVRVARGEPEAGRPALLVVAGLDAPQVFSSAVALDLVERLAAGAEDGVDELLANTTVYVIPRANPDGAEARFLNPRREVTATGAGFDTDRDGREGEDAPSDVNGDGLVTHMRVPDPEGEWMADPTDARALVRADAAKGQRGVWKLVAEGRDSDGDEEASEDAPRDAVVNRNFPAGWSEHAPDAGVFPSDEPEAFALLEFVLAHPEIGAVVTYGELDSLAEPPKAAAKEDGREVPYPAVMKDDAPRLAELARRYREIVETPAKGFGEHAGSFQRWLYQERGLPALNVVLWDLPLEAPPKKGDAAPAESKPEEPEAPEGPEDEAGAAGDAEANTMLAERPAEGDEAETASEDKAAEPGEIAKKKDEPKPSDDAKRLKWIDGEGAEEAWRHVGWTPFDHPELGPVEIGGFAPFARTEPPRASWERIANEQLAFVVALGGMLPRAAWAECTARALGADLYEVEAVLANDALLPLSTAAGRRTRTVRPARLRLVLSEGDVLLAGPRQVLVRELDGSGERRTERWLVRTASPTALALELDTDGAGRQTVNPEVQR